MNFNEILIIIIIIFLISYHKHLYEYFIDNNNNKDKFKIIIYYPFHFNTHIGGIIVLTYFAIKINEILKDKIVYLFSDYLNIINTENFYFDNFTKDTNFDKDKTIVIYSEGIEGNPLNAKYVIRWILAELSINTSSNIYKTWEQNDLVYYFNKEPKIIQNSEKIGTIYKLLTLIYLNPKVIITNFEKRNDWCFTYRKSHIHKNINNIHPNDSYELDRFISQDDSIKAFNKYKYFVCYDPLTFLSIMSLLCGCITIIYPIEGISKKEWLNTTIFYEYMKDNNINDIYGLAYGIEDISYAEETISKAPKLINDIINNINNNYINLFLDDIEKILKKEITFENTVKNNYY
jgi:hypothetical protein